MSPRCLGQVEVSAGGEDDRGQGSVIVNSYRNGQNSYCHRMRTLDRFLPKSWCGHVCRREENILFVTSWLLSHWGLQVRPVFCAVSNGSIVVGGNLNTMLGDRTSTDRCGNRRQTASQDIQCMDGGIDNRSCVGPTLQDLPSPTHFPHHQTVSKLSNCSTVLVWYLSMCGNSPCIINSGNSIFQK